MAPEQATYRQQLLEEYRGNPLIEALPDIWSAEEVSQKLTRIARHNEAERSYPPEYRIHCISRLSQGYYQPLEQHIDIEQRISRCIRQGYLSRNPFSASYARTLEEGFSAQTNRRPMQPAQEFSPHAAGFTILGISGIGKSTAVESILGLYPQVITHSEYKGKPFCQKQLVWLKTDCPFDGGIKGLCYSFLNAVDRAVGTTYYMDYASSRITVDSLMVLMQRIAASYSLGILVVDEIQHLKTAGHGSEKMLNFFVTLVNTIGVPVVLIGTPLAMSLLQGEFRQARRSSGSGDLLWPTMSRDAAWDVFIQAMWPYQWTAHPVALTKEMSRILYDESQGITVLAVILYEIVQLEAILNTTETFTAEDIRKGAHKRLNFVQPMIRALRSGNTASIEKFGDIAMSLIDTYAAPESLPETPKQKKSSNPSLSDLITFQLQDLGIAPEKARLYADRACSGKSPRNTNPTDVLKEAFAFSMQDQSDNSKSESNDTIDKDDLRSTVNDSQK